MFLDLNIKWSGIDTATNICKSAASLGFSGVALNVNLDLTQRGENGKSHRCPISDFHLATLRHELSHTVHHSFNAFYKFSDLHLSHLRSANTCGDFDSALNFLVIRRLTITVGHVNQISVVNSLGRSLADYYDILAVRPVDEKTYHSLLREGDFDVLCLNFDQPRLPFRVRREQLGLAVRRGCLIEICIAAMLNDVDARTHFFANIEQVVRWVPSDNIIITSGASSCLDLRGPCDLSNLADVMGIKAPRSSVSNAAVSALYKGACRRFGGGYVGERSSTTIGALTQPSVDAHLSAVAAMKQRCATPGYYVDEVEDVEAAGV